MAEEIRHVNMVSTGQLLSGLSADRVVERLNRRFGLNEQQALAVLKKGTVLKKSIRIEDAKAIALQFARLGLKVAAQTVRQPVPNAAQAQPIGRDRPSGPAASEPASCKSRTDSGQEVDNGGTASWLREDIAPPKVPFYWTHPGFLVLSGALPGLLVPILYLGVVTWLSIGLLGSLWVALTTAFFGATYSVTALLGMSILALARLLLLVFLLKPILARHSGWPGAVLWREEAPALFALVEALCDSMNVPHPTRICVNNTVRVETGPTGGASGLLHGHFQLTLGLPLVAAMNKRQLAGVLAQQLGYCTSPAAMRTYFIVHCVNAWLATRAFEPDHWDRRLEHFRRHSHYRVLRALVHWIQQGAAYTRLLLCGALLLNRHLTVLSARQLDDNADYYEAVVGGSDVFAANTKVLMALAAARQRALEINAQAWNHHNKWLSDFPAAVRALLDQMDEEHCNTLATEQVLFSFQNPGFDYTNFQNADLQNAGSQNIGLESAAAHNIGAHARPDNIRRVDKVEALAHPGLVSDSSGDKRGNSEDLFEDFEGLSVQVSLEEYQNGGIKALAKAEPARNQGINPERYMVDNSQILALSESMESAQCALSDYLGSSFDGRIMEFDEPRNPELLTMNPQQIIDWIRVRLMEYRENQKQLKKALAELQRKCLGQCYIAAGIAVDCRYFGFVSAHKACIDDALKNARDTVRKLTGQLHQVDRMFFQRIMLAIYKMDGRGKNIAKRYLYTLQAMGALQELLQQLQVSRLVMMALSNKQSEPWRLEADWAGKALPQQKVQVKACAKLVLKVVEVSLSISDFNDDGEEQTLCDVIFASTGKITPRVHELSPLALAELAAQVESALRHHYGYRLGQLAEMCGKTEQRMGVGPLKLFRAQR